LLIWNFVAGGKRCVGDVAAGIVGVEEEMFGGGALTPEEE
jgi:hypothetical protein